MACLANEWRTARARKASWRDGLRTARRLCRRRWTAGRLPARARETIRLLMLDVGGLCVAVREHRLCRGGAWRAPCPRAEPPPSAMTGVFGPYDAALINGTAAHGEDYDDTFEGGPVHAGAVIVPAVLAAAEHRGLSGDARCQGHRGGRGDHVPHEPRRAASDPQSLLSIRLPCSAPRRRRQALRRRSVFRPAKSPTPSALRGSLASGIIEYLADGSWTKRLHRGRRRAIGNPRGALGGGRIHRARNRARRPTRVLQGFRAVQSARLRAAC